MASLTVNNANIVSAGSASQPAVQLPSHLLEVAQKIQKRVAFFFANSTETASCISDPNSCLRNTLVATGQIAAEGTAATISTFASGLLATYIGGVIALNGGRDFISSVQCDDKEGAALNAAFTAVGGALAGLGGALTTLTVPQIAQMVGSTSLNLTPVAAAGLGAAVSAIGVPMYAIYGIYAAALLKIAKNFETEFKAIDRNKPDAVLTFLKGKIDLTDAEKSTLTTPEQQKKALEKKLRAFERRTDSECVQEVVRALSREQILNDALAKLRAMPAGKELDFDFAESLRKQGITIGERVGFNELTTAIETALKTPVDTKSLMNKVEAANYKTQVKQILRIIIAIVGIAAGIAVIMTGGGLVASILFGLVALLWLSVDCSRLRNHILQKAWEKSDAYKAQLVQKPVAVLPTLADFPKHAVKSEEGMIDALNSYLSYLPSISGG